MCLGVRGVSIPPLPQEGAFLQYLYKTHPSVKLGGILFGDLTYVHKHGAPDEGIGNSVHILVPRFIGVPAYFLVVLYFF